MAKKDAVAGVETKPVEAKAVKAQEEAKAESEYTAEELAQNAKRIFKTRSECVAAALKSANVTRCSISKAKEIVNSFMKKEVK